jgi:2-methylcitrate synthase
MSEPTPGFQAEEVGGAVGVVAATPRCARSGAPGNDLHYRGYDILDVAVTASSKEIAYLLIPRQTAEPCGAGGLQEKLVRLRTLPIAVRGVLEHSRGDHPMDVMRSGVSALGCVLPEKDDHSPAGARDIADRLIASLARCWSNWYHYSHAASASTSRARTIRSRSLPALLHGEKPSRDWWHAMHTSLILYAEHEFKRLDFAARVIAGTGADMYSAIAGAIARCAAEAWRRERSRLRIQQRYETPDQAEQTSGAVSRTRSDHRFGHPVYTISDPATR